MRFALLLTLLSISLTSFATEEDCTYATSGALNPIGISVNTPNVDQCPNRHTLVTLCLLISTRLEDEGGEYEYQFQRSLLEVGCVKPSDSKEKIREKIKNSWNAHESELKCSSPKFDVPNGHILKYAVSEHFEDFLDEAIDLRVNLNRVDPADKRTILDYIKFHLDRQRGGPLEKIYQNYYEKFRKAGAKHRAELCNS